MFFHVHKKGIKTKLEEKMGKKHPAGQPFCNVQALHTALGYIVFSGVSGSETRGVQNFRKRVPV